jgi:hypothetical protein
MAATAKKRALVGETSRTSPDDRRTKTPSCWAPTVLSDVALVAIPSLLVEGLGLIVARTWER